MKVASGADGCRRNTASGELPDSGSGLGLGTTDARHVLDPEVVWQKGGPAAICR